MIIRYEQSDITRWRIKRLGREMKDHDRLLTGFKTTTTTAKKEEEEKKVSAATPFGFSCGDTARRAGGSGAVGRWGGARA